MKNAFSKIASYWLNVCRTLAGFEKSAEIGGGQDVPFEQAFSNLAHAYLKDKAPGLIDYELGFQLLDRNQENTKAVGVFGFQVGKQLIYAPVFFLNGDLKGHELLYIRNQDMFVPLKENWLNYILNRKPHVLGEGVDRNLSQLGVMPPHLYQISRSPHKFASVVSKWPKWMQEFAPDLGRLVSCNPLRDDKYTTCPDVPSILKEGGERMLKSMIHMFSEFPKTAEAFEGFYDLEVVGKIVTEVANAKKAAAELTILDKIAEKKEKKEQKGNNLNVHVITDKEMTDGLSTIDLSNEDQKVLIRERVLIKDKRKDEDVSVAYNVQTKLDLTSPDETGLYKILTKPGKFEECLVIKAPYSRKGRHQFGTIVRTSDSGNKAYLNTHLSNVYARSHEEGQSYRDWFDKLPDADELPTGGLCVILTYKGEGTVPFEVEESLSTEDGVKTYDVYFRCYGQTERPGFLPPINDIMYIDRDINQDYGYYPGSRICLTGKEGNSIQARGGTLYIPKGSKLLKLKDRKKGDTDSDDSEGMSSHSEPPAIQPGSLIDAQIMLFEKLSLSRMEIRSNGSTFSIHGAPDAGYIDSLVNLVTVHGLREKQARTMLDEAKKESRREYLIKKANPYLTATGPHAPSMPDQQVSFDPMTSGNYPTRSMTEYNIPISDMLSTQTDRSIYQPTNVSDPWGQTGRNVDPQRVVMEAAQTGQKEVFDTAMLGSLLKATRDDTMVDRYMGDLAKGMDRLGRILFLFYWHQDSFEDRYGKGDLPELEDSLRNAFEAVGDIFLFLKQKTVDPNPDEVGGRVDLESLSNA